MADIRRQWPELAEDIKLPEFFEPERFFSSVFRIGSPGVQLWTHYDVGTQFVGMDEAMSFSHVGLVEGMPNSRGLHLGSVLRRTPVMMSQDQ